MAENSESNTTMNLLQKEPEEQKVQDSRDKQHGNADKGGDIGEGMLGNTNIFLPEIDTHFSSTSPKVSVDDLVAPQVSF